MALLEDRLRVFIRSTLREQRISYADVAREMGVSESSVKRLFTSKKMTMDTFERICQILGISPAEALLSANDGQANLAQLTLKQEDFLCKNPLTDYIFLRLMFGFTLADIREELSLSSFEMTKHLARLERQDLVRQGKRGTVRVPKRGPFRWIKGGPFEKQFNTRFFEELSAKFLELIPTESEEKAHAFELYLSEGSHLNLTNELLEIVSRYKKLTKLEQQTLPVKSLKPVAVLLGVKKVNLWKEILLGQKD